MGWADDIPERVERTRQWYDDLAGEVVQLPDTLRRLREAVANLEVVSRRLADSTEGIERLNQFSATGLVEASRRLADAAAARRTPRADAGAATGTRAGGEAPGADDLIDSAVEAFAALAEMNPFWRAVRAPGKGPSAVAGGEDDLPRDPPRR